MKRFVAVPIFITAVALSANLYAKPKVLSAAAEAKWIAAVKNHKTKDGSTVSEVLTYAHSARPEKFKAGTFDVGYNGESGEPDTVGIDYWIGRKRSANDAFIDLAYPMTPGGQVGTPPKESMASALDGGKAEFVRAVDEAYKSTCKPSPAMPADC